MHGLTYLFYDSNPNGILSSKYPLIQTNNSILNVNIGCYQYHVKSFTLMDDESDLSKNRIEDTERCIFAVDMTLSVLNISVPQISSDSAKCTLQCKKV